MPTRDDAALSLQRVIDRLDRYEVMLDLIVGRWTDLDFDDRREIGARWPHLAAVLVEAESI